MITYHLPEEKIARFPLENRDSSKLLVYDKGNIIDETFSNLPHYIDSASFLVFNNSRVVHARIIFRKPTGGSIEIFCLHPHQKDVQQAMQQKRTCRWHCLIGGASKWKKGQVLEKQITINSSISLSARFLERTDDDFLIEFLWDDNSSFAEVMNAAGTVPLPPYLKRDSVAQDEERYQTIYASIEGSVAAPTAGLHFTEKLFSELERKGIKKEYLTLHVGAGTFKPVQTQSYRDHVMHEEEFEVSTEVIKKIIDHSKNYIIPVGTTSLRTLESIYWLGVKSLLTNKIETQLDQWDAYEKVDKDLSQVLEHLISLLKSQGLDRLNAKTKLMIVPGYQPRIARALITNFHQPESSLLLLVAALIGDDWKRVYEHALKNNYRFLSYGDANLLRW